MATILHWLDYIAFGFTLILTVAVGMFYAAKGRKNKNAKTEEFLLAGRKMSVLPVSISIFVSWLSAIAYLGDPVEVYYHGAVYIYLYLGSAAGCLLVARTFAPFYNSLHIISVFEYLEKRYHPVLRYLALALRRTLAVLYIGIVVYGPSLAFSQVTGIPEWLSILTIGVVGTFYTSLGGMKAVLWVDSFQSILMLLGLVLLLVLGTSQAGGVNQVWHTASQHGRINLLKADPNPLVRSSVWTYLFGGLFRVFVQYSTAQALVQRYCTLPTPRDAAVSVYLNIPFHLVVGSLFTLTGLVMFSFYADCDPLKEGRISSRNQLVPLFMVDVLGCVPGLSGLFLACIFSASLSTISSAMNGICANVLVDIVTPLHRWRTGLGLTDATQLLIAKLVSAVTGFLVVVVALVILYSQSDIFTASIKIAGLFGGPIGGLFFAGKMFPFVDSVSACIGLLIGTSLSLSIAIGAKLYPPPPQALPLPPSICPDILLNMSTTPDSMSTQYQQVLNSTFTAQVPVHISNSQIHTVDVFGLSPLYLSPLGFISTTVIALTLAGVKELLTYLCSRNTSNYEMAELTTTETRPGSNSADHASQHSLLKL